MALRFRYYILSLLVLLGTLVSVSHILLLVDALPSLSLRPSKRH
jgi:hypothetical protein